MDLLPQNAKQVVVNADDFGLTSSVNQAILACHKAGVVKSTSVLANGDGLKEALELAKDNPKLGLGLHLALVFGKPTASADKVKSLLFDKGEFARGYPAFTKRYLTGGIKLSEVEYEWECQREKLAKVRLDHLDSHQHLHLFPELFKLTVKLALKWKIPFVRVPLENVHSSLKGSTVLSSKVLNFYAAGKKKALERAGLKTTPHFFGSSFSGGMLKPVWLDIWDKIPAGVTEIMCHPGYENAEARAQYGWANRWQEELEALTSPDTLQFALKNGILFTNFTELAILDQFINCQVTATLKRLSKNSKK